MQNLQILVKEMEANGNKEYLQAKIPFLESKIEKLFAQLKSCDDFEKAKSYFRELETIQRVLAQMMFKYRVDVSQKMAEFVRDFDRIDDVDMQKYLFEKFQKS